MRSPKRWLSVLALAMSMTLPVAALAAEHTVGTWDEFQQAWEGDTDEQVRLVLSGDIEMMAQLLLQEGRTYTIDGQNYVLKDVSLMASGGKLVVNGDIEGGLYAETSGPDYRADITVNGDIQSQTDGLRVEGSGEVTVAGDIHAEGNGVEAKSFDGSLQVTVGGSVTAGQNGVIAENQGSVAVGGDVSAQAEGVTVRDQGSVTVDGDVQAGQNGVLALQQGSVAVGGDVTGGGDTGVTAEGSAVVTVGGDVDGGSATDPDGNVYGGTGVRAEGDASVTVEGSVTGGDGLIATQGEDAHAGEGVVANGSAQVHVGGDVTGGDGNLDDALMDVPSEGGAGGDGVQAAENASVTVEGNVAGGSAQGVVSVGGSGIVAQDSASVEVAGSAAGGDVTADSETHPTQGAAGRAGQGVWMDGSAEVTVGGDVRGGNSDHSQLAGGNGVAIMLLEKTDQPQEGSLTVEGAVCGGSAPQDGVSGAGLFYIDPYSATDHFLWPSQKELPQLHPEDFAGLDQAEQVDLILGKYQGLCDLVYPGATESDQILRYWPKLAELVELDAQILDGLTGAELSDAADVLTEQIRSRMEAAADFQTLRQMAVEQFNQAIVWEWSEYLRATCVGAGDIAVWQLPGDGDRMASTHLGTKIAQAMLAQTEYLIQLDAPENGTLSVDRTHAAAGQTVRVTAAAHEGYQVAEVTMNGTALSPVDGVCTFEMPAGGGVIVSARMEAVPQASQSPAPSPTAEPTQSPQSTSSPGPDSSDAPAATQEPNPSDAPAATQKPNPSDAPAMTQEPVLSPVPSATAAPGAGSADADNPKTGDSYAWMIACGLLILLSGGTLLRLRRPKHA